MQKVFKTLMPVLGGVFLLLFLWDPHFRQTTIDSIRHNLQSLKHNAPVTVERR